MIHPPHFRQYVLRPVLQSLELWSPEAEELLMGTAAVESGFQYLHQIKGPAVGIFQMEPNTIRDILHWIEKRSLASCIAKWMIKEISSVEQCHGNLYFAAALARVFYWKVPAGIPVDLPGWAKYWKRHYNTPLGKGTEEKYIEAYNRLIKPAT